MLLLFFCSFAFAQNKTLDSLNLVLKNAKHDTTNTKTLNLIAEEIYSSNPDTAIFLCNRVIKIVLNSLTQSNIVKQVLIREQSVALNNLGALYCGKGYISKAYEYYKQSLAISEKIGNVQEKANSLHGIGFIYDERGDIPKALEYYKKSLNISKISIHLVIPAKA